MNRLILLSITCLYLVSCEDNNTNNEMVGLLAKIEKQNALPTNTFASEAKYISYDSSLKTVTSPIDSISIEYRLSGVYLEMGNETKAIEIYELLLKRIPESEFAAKYKVMRNLGIAYLRYGERINCINDHSGASCLFPIAGRGIHADKSGSEKAIEIYEQMLSYDYADLETRWLLNIAYMTTGGYPDKVPKHLLIKDLEKGTPGEVKPFTDVSINMGLNTKNMAGGSIVDDFNNDGYLDLVTSSWGLKQGMHFCRNNGDGTFTEVSDSSGLKQFTGGLNMMQTDYDNDGLKDIFVLRGAWKGTFGKEPNSLLKNNGDGTFRDVTKESGLLSFHPTQTATWADFNNDGWLDVFIGNESMEAYDPNPCELYINNKNGTFIEVAAASGCDLVSFVKGVTSGDYDNDGLQDLFISTLSDQKMLLKNTGLKNNIPQFKNVTAAAGLDNDKVRTFPTWFWDYDNDGWLDILVCRYNFNRSLAWYAAAEAMGRPEGNSGHIFLFRNKQNGTFEDVSEKCGLDKVAFAMGSNFGDIDNDGYLDFYLGTGNPEYQSLVPNKMFKNIGGKTFVDITNTARVGNLQKGHGVSFADMDNDGDVDIHIDMGGAYGGDAYQNSLYINPGQNNNHWINISLQGTTSNRAAIGAKIKVTFNEDGKTRSVYRDVNSGGSFGSNPLMQHIGVGNANSVLSIQIRWPGNNTEQVLQNMSVDENIIVTQGNQVVKKMKLQKADFVTSFRGLIGCSPADYLKQ